MANKEKSNFIIISIMVAVFFIAVITIVLVSLNQRDNNLQPEILTPLAEEKVISIKDDSKNQINDVQKRREGFSLTDKPFDEGNYAYDERTKDFRLVCINPCPVSKKVLDQEFAAIAYAVSTVRGLTKSDIDESLLPFEVHASEDDVCPMNPTGIAYMTKFTDNNGYSRGLLCFFYDKIPYNRDKFPYSTSVHEVMHLFESNKLPYSRQEGGSVLWEGLSEMMESFFIKGNDLNSFCWKGNNWYKSAIQNSHDAHWVGGDLFYNLCKQHGFDYDDMPRLFDELESKKGDVDNQEFVNIMNRIVGSDTTPLFKKADVI